MDDFYDFYVFYGSYDFTIKPFDDLNDFYVFYRLPFTVCRLRIKRLLRLQYNPLIINTSNEHLI